MKSVKKYIYSRVMNAAIIAPATFVICASTSAGIPITEDGVPKAVIVKQSKASKVIDFAATELQKYVQKISDATLPIREGKEETSGPSIVLGTAKIDPTRQGLECDSFTIKTEGNRLLLTGNTDRGVLYAVYAFLESLGSAWLEPGEAGEIVPRKPTIVVSNINLASKPAFDLRGMCIYDQGEGKETIDWMGKMRMNFALWRGEQGAGIEERGILLMKGTDHRLSTRMGLPTDWFKNLENAKYIATINGKREIPKGSKKDMEDSFLYDVEPCMSNNESIELLLKSSLNYIKKNPSIFLFDMRADDKLNNWCECEECCKSTPTDIYVKYVNQLARKIHDKWPEKKLSLIAYFDTMSPPKKVSPDLSMDNMILWFAPITRPYTSPVNSPTDEKVELEFPRNKATWPVTDGAWKPFLLAWREAFKGPILVLDYYHWSGIGNTNPKLRSSYFYMRPDVIAADLRYYKELGLSGSIGVEPSPLKLPNCWNQYLKAKLLWDPSQNIAELERYYDQQFYGNCTDATRKCLTTIAKEECDNIESVKKIRETVAKFATETKTCQKTPSVEERLGRISLWAEYIALRKMFFIYKDTEAEQKTANELNNYLKLNSAKITRYYNELDSMMVNAEFIKPKNIEANILLKAPIIDGAVTADEWKAAAEYWFSSYEALQKPEEFQKTKVSLGLNKDTLYIAVQAYEKQIANLVTNSSKNEMRVWDDDSLEIIFAPFKDDYPYYQIVVNALGTYQILKYTEKGKSTEASNVTFKHSTKTCADRFELELALPIAQFGKEALETPWRFNIFRSRQPSPSQASGLNFLSGSYHKFNIYNKLSVR